MKKVYHILYCISLVFCIFACSDDYSAERGLFPTKDPHFLKADTTNLSFEYDGKKSETFNISCVGVTWKLACSEKWVTLSDTSGTSNAKVTVTVTPNDKYSESGRKATIRLSGSGVSSIDINITQKAPPLNFSVIDPTTKKEISEVTFSEASGSKDILVSCNYDWSVTADKDVSWLSVSKNTNGFKIAVTENKTGLSRTANIKVSSEKETKVIKVVQQEPSLSFEVLDKGTVVTEINLEAKEGSSKEITVKSNYDWNVSAADESWLSVTKKTSGFIIKAKENSTGEVRSNVITVSSKGETKKIKVEQNASYVKVSSSSKRYNKDTNTLKFGDHTSFVKDTIIVESDAAWTISNPHEDWMKVYPKSGKAGKTEVAVSVEKNLTKDERSGVLTIGSKKVNVIREGVILYADTKPLEFTNNGGTRKFYIKSNAPWRISSQSSLVTFSKKEGKPNIDKGGETIEISLPPRAGDAIRNAILLQATDGSGLSVNVNFTQQGTELYADTTPLEFTRYGGTRKFFIKSNAPWKISSQCTLVSFSKKEGKANVDKGGETIQITMPPREGADIHNSIKLEATDGSGKYLKINITQHCSTTNNVHAYVDLGLSVKWATMNVGATEVAGSKINSHTGQLDCYGEYYAWGETSPKERYTWANLRYCSGSTKDGPFTKYVTSYVYGTVDKKSVLDFSDDAAHANWGGSWRMPTKAEQDELRTKCSWTWITKNGVKGYEVKSKTNGNSIFLPAAGYRDSSSFRNVGSYGSYWSSSLTANSAYFVYYLNYSSSKVEWDYGYRNLGRCIRAVCP